MNLLRTLCICCAMNAECMQRSAVGTLCGLLQRVTDAGCNQGPSKSNLRNDGLYELDEKTKTKIKQVFSLAVL